MINGLKLWNFSSGTHPEEELKGLTFILKTCQRSLVLSFDIYPFKTQSIPAHELHHGEEAYLYLLETICGLKSKLIGENEIVGQFKEAYKVYAQSTLKNTKLLLILEKLFKDAKDIRTQYLIGISQKTYASLTRKHLIQKAKADHVVVVGSGALAEDLINQFKKKSQVSICARNSIKVRELAELHNLTIIPWENRQTLVNSPYIANTIGTKEIIFDLEFFKLWKTNNPAGVLVDLGSPSVISTNLTLAEGVVRLEDIFNEGAIVEGQKQYQIEQARLAMQDITQKRKSLFEAKLKQSLAVPTPQITQDMRYL
jgi:glutamyl-tRNA reductase